MLHCTVWVFVILISHNMPHVFEFADRIHIQRLDAACPALATAIATAAALVDVHAIVIDGELNHQLWREVLSRTHTALDTFNWQGMVRPRLVEGEIGADARAMGGAILPLYPHFAPRHVLFLKSGMSA